MLSYKQEDTDKKKLVVSSSAIILSFGRIKPRRFSLALIWYNLSQYHTIWVLVAFQISVYFACLLVAAT